MPTHADVQLLCTNPAAFLRANALSWLGPGPAGQQEIEALMIDGGPGVARVRTGSVFLGFGNAKASVPSFTIRDRARAVGWEDATSQVFPAMWSGYAAGAERHAQLAAVGGPDIMLTPEFTGCAAACQVNADGSARFSHYNLMQQGKQETLDALEMRAAIADTYDLAANNVAAMTKEGQRAHAKGAGGAVRSTVVGFRRHGHWEFWVQHCENKADGQGHNLTQIRSVAQLR